MMKYSMKKRKQTKTMLQKYVAPLHPVLKHNIQNHKTFEYPIDQIKKVSKKDYTFYVVRWFSFCAYHLRC